MKHMKIVLPAVVLVFAVSLATGVYFVLNPVETTLEFTVRDAVAGSWVWDATFRLQNRMIRGFYQSDQSPRPFVFSGLTPGPAELELAAPGYVPVSMPVDLKRGANVLDEPIDLLGYEIPNLWQFIVVEQRVGNDIAQEIRLVGTNGRAIRNHPVVGLWLVARVAVQTRDGLPVRERTEAGSQRGDELFRGILPWTFDPRPDTTFRYASRIPGNRIRPDGNPYRVIDYLMVVPDPRVTSPDQMRGIMEGALDLPLEAIASYLRPYVEQGLLTPYTYTSWNVERGS